LVGKIESMTLYMYIPATLLLANVVYMMI